MNWNVALAHSEKQMKNVLLALAKQLKSISFLSKFKSICFG
ncbi:hypothetical protein BH10BAC3_BH10BAC3_40860 [soil metagenome]